ncbi:MAG: hypothetical protein KF883_00550 [Thermomicrobiales bacterium]|nr:hypothetical protein [Thermomicrobiales bacterium]
MAERKPLHVEPASETGKLLELANVAPVSIESGGALYRIERQEPATLETYDPALALAGLRAAIGLYDGIDVEKAMEEIRAQRGQDSSGRRF